MPRGKLHYEAYEEDGMLVEHWLDPHGHDHTELNYLDDDDGIPEGCAACGGDYPNCTTSCPMFDD